MPQVPNTPEEDHKSLNRYENQYTFDQVPQETLIILESKPEEEREAALPSS